MKLFQFIIKLGDITFDNMWRQADSIHLGNFNNSNRFFAVFI